MIDFIVHHQAEIRECINGVASVLFLTLTIMISVFLWDTWATAGSASYHRWAGLPGVPTACVLFWVFIAEWYRSLNVWWGYLTARISSEHVVDEKFDPIGVGIFNASSTASTIGYLAAGIILCLGLLRGIYIFTPPDWKGRVWLYATAAAAVFVFIPIYSHL